MPNQIQDLFGKWIQFDCPTDGATFSIAVANRVWDPGSLSWVSETQPAGGGGGPATIADGADVTQGAIADAAVSSDAPGTVSAKLRGLVKIQASVWDSVNGRLRVDGSGVTQPVSGTVSISSFPASQAVTIADGADVAEGALADAAVIGDTAGSVSAKLRGINKTVQYLPGLAIPIYDYVAQVQAALTDTWTFKTGGAGGTTVATVTITYTDATKAVIDNVART